MVRLGLELFGCLLLSFDFFLFLLCVFFSFLQNIKNQKATYLGTKTTSRRNSKYDHPTGTLGIFLSAPNFIDSSVEIPVT